MAKHIARGSRGRRAPKGGGVQARLVLKGEPELMRVLNKLPYEVERRIVLRAVAKVAKPIAHAAAAGAPRGPTGLLRRSMGVKAKRYTRGQRATIAVIGPKSSVTGKYRGYKTRPALYAHLVERGTAPHFLRYKRIGPLQVIRQMWVHPGTTPKPFLKPAFEALKRAALGALAATIRGGLERYVKRQAKMVAKGGPR